MINSKNSNKKPAFTLAEVLITLLVIGVVAALTVPALIQKYSNRSLYTGFMKVYNTILNTLELSKIENGTPDSWAFDYANQDAAREKYIYPYISYSKICDADAQDSCLDYEVKGLSGGNSFNVGDKAMDKAALLQDGSILYTEISEGGDEVVFVFDINGSKGPNVIGRDFFIMDYRKVDDKWGFELDGDFGAEDCNTTNGFGQGCPAKLLKDGKMDY